MNTQIHSIDPDRLDGLAEAGNYLGFCEKTIKLAAQQAGLPHSRMGRVWRFSKVALTAWRNGPGASVVLKWPEKKPAPTDPKPRRRRKAASTH